MADRADRVRLTSPARTAEVLAAAVAEEPTYPEVGATAGPLPAGYHHLQRSAVVGRGRDDFARAAAAVRSWQVQERAGMRPLPTTPTTELGATVVQVVGIAGRGAVVPCRVVRSIDEPTRAGFAYGTLPGHPETGEEAFVVTLAGDGAVVFGITAFSRQSWPLARAAAPVARLAQTVMVRRYLRTLR